jgi:hypothetical protein
MWVRGLAGAAVSALAVAGALSGCAGPRAAAAHPPPAAHGGDGSSAGAGATTPASSPTPGRTPKRPAPGRVSVRQIRLHDGVTVTVATFSGNVRYVLHAGSEDPGPAAVGLRAGSQIGRAEARRLLAAFNGGFKLDTGAGGYEQQGRVISRLRPGFASLVIDRAGRAQIGVWGHGVPRPGEQVASVRQNLTLLVSRGRVSPSTANWPAWGATLGGGEDVARSGLGENRAGELLFAGTMSASPGDLARALVLAGARTAMELDINPEWVQLDVAHRPGGPLQAAIPGQNRPADQYLLGWTRDFIAVLAG